MSERYKKDTIKTPDTLTALSKEIIKVALVDYLIDRGLQGCDVTADTDFAWNLVPYIAVYETWWKNFDSVKELEAATLFPDYIRHLKNQMRSNGMGLDKKIEARKTEQEEEVPSKDSQVISTKIPTTRKAK